MICKIMLASVCSLALATAVAAQTSPPYSVNVVSGYGADNTGATDAAGAINMAISYAIAHHAKEVLFPSGIYKVAVPINIATVSGSDSPIKLRGLAAGDGVSIQAWGTSNVLNITSDTPVDLENIAIKGDADYVGSCVQVAGSPSGSYNTLSTWRDVTTQDCGIGIDVQNGQLFTLDNYRALDYSTAGLSVATPSNTDIGDSFVINSTFDDYGNGHTSAAGIQHISSGGLHVANSKFNGGGYCYKMVLAATTSDLLWTNNSCENMAMAGMDFSAASDSIKFANTAIAASEFFGMPVAIAVHDSGSHLLNNVSIAGDVFQIPSGGTAISVADTADLSISGGSIECFTSVSCTGLTSGSGATGVVSGLDNQATTPASVGSGLSYSALNGTAYQQAKTSFTGAVDIHSPSSQTPLVANGSGAQLIVDYLGGGSNFVDAATTSFRTYPGFATTATLDHATGAWSGGSGTFNAASGLALRASSTITSGPGDVAYFVNQASGGGALVVGVGASGTTNPAAGMAAIGLGSTGYKLYFDSHGYVGVQNSAPNYPLDVGGGVNATTYSVGAAAGVSCSGAPSAGFSVVYGIVTHC